jgi:site-specific DNA-methyltransferase (adenine-specific)
MPVSKSSTAPKSAPIVSAPSQEPSAAPSAPHLPDPVFRDAKHHIRIFQGDCLDVLAALPPDSVDLIFADPPYFLSNNGITCHAGRMVSVNKGEWDRSRGAEANHAFNRAWLAACQRVLKPDGSIWVSGTSHVIHSVGFAMQQLEFKLLNDISWVKPNPPPNLSCRYFTHATETIIWAAKNKKSRHTFHYKLMKEIAGGKQMKSVWTIPPPEPWEKKFGKHPTQKPVALLERILLAASFEGDLVLDPFLGSGTSALAALRHSRKIVGIDFEATWIQLTLRRVCSDLVQVEISLFCLHFDLDLDARSMDRSNHAPNRAARVPSQLQLVQQERRFYFIGRDDRRVIFSTLADSLDEARAKFRASGRLDSDALFIIKTETEIYLA